MKKYKHGWSCLIVLLAYSLAVVYLNDHSDNVQAWQMIVYASLFGPFLAIIAIFGLLSQRSELNKLKTMYEKTGRLDYSNPDCITGLHSGPDHSSKPKPPTT